MNISHPIGAEITSVNFGFFNTEDVQNISVKQIVNPTVFDNLGHPTKGGLYDLALGPFLGKTSCATCHLDERYCPGHFGHIILPQPVYHPLLFKSMLSLLKATCIYCHHFRLKTAEVHRYACKLKLLSRGLILEARVVDDVGKDISALMPELDIDTKPDEEDVLDGDANGDEEEAVVNRLLQKREKFVRGALRRAESGNYKKFKSTTAAEERKEVARECMKMLGHHKRCNNCGAISPSFKSEENAKIFERALLEKDAKYMAGRGMTRVAVEMDGVNKPQLDGVGSQDIMMDEDDDVVSDESGEDVMSDVEPEPNPKTKGKPAKAPRSQQYILSTAVRSHLRRLFENEKAILSLLFNVDGSAKALTADNFFLSVIAVPPTRYRPPAREGDTIRESAQNTQLSKILNTCQRIALLNVRREEESTQKSSDKYQFFHQQIDAFVQLQLDVNSLVDSAASMSVADRLSGRVPPPGIKQTLEKKEGLFRKHMMGKRVNFAARSVISPDPNIETSEIGIPPFIAQKLTFPEPVTPWNFEKLRRAVINGPGTYPGASHVEHDDGKLTSLEFLSLERRTALANTLLTPDGHTRLTSANSPLPTYLNKKVHRHLENDDILLVNRQPTLHKPSIMGHRAKVLTREKTIRLHYANCNTYNADFDGDEMNVHFPQNSLARAEAYNIANTDNQYLGPTNGNPLRGLIQDHISAAVWMSKRDTFFTRDEYQQLLYGSIQPEEGGCGGQEGRIVTLPPTIIKPRPLWTGKQVISSILLNITPNDRPGLYLKSQSLVKNTSWVPAFKTENEWWKNSEEQNVIFDNGELLCGILDKSQLGPSAYGMIHSVYEVYGADVAGRLLSALGRLLTKYSQMQGLSCGMDDLRITQEGRTIRKRVLKEKAGIGKQVAIEYVGMKDAYDENLFLERMQEVVRDPEKSSGLDRAMQTATSELTSVMYKELVPVHLLKKFPYNNMQNMTQSKAKGGGENANLISSIIGQQSLEGGRVPIMVSGKTLPSFAPYETDIRAGGYVTSCYLTGIKPHEYFFYCMAGREGLIDTAVKTSRSGYLQRCLVKHLEGMTVQYDNTVRDSDGSLIQFLYGEDGLDVVKQKHLLDFDFSAQNWRSLISKYEPKNAPEWLADKTAGRYAKKALRKAQKYDPVLSKFSPSRNLGSTSEDFHIKLDSFIDKNSEARGLFTEKSDDLTSKKFRALMELKYLRSLIDPGEAVGVLAAQSIGEPSTQMTLNTFHLAGFGAGNVTLGVPRLREIIMTASRNIKTPNVTLTMRSGVADTEADQLAKKLSFVMLDQLMMDIVVTEKVTKDQDEMNSTKSYVIRLNLYPRKEYEEEYMVTLDEVEHVLSSQFLKYLAARVKTTVKKTSGGRKKKVGETEAAPSIGQGKKSKDAQDVVDERIPAHNGAEASDDDDGDAYHEKRQRQSKEQAGYDAPDEEDRVVIRQQDKELERDSDPVPEPKVNRRAGDEATSEPLEDKLGKIDFNQMKQFNPNLVRFNFDKVNGEWCEMEFEYPLKMGKILMENVVEKVCHQCVIREIPGIKQCVKMPRKNDSDPITLMTQGRNLKGLWDLGDMVDLNLISSNDIGAIMDTYGVEAGRACIIKEINSIFGMYSITVDLRHLTLIADYMTFGGGYKPFNRMGLDANVSPFLKMSFEQTCVFLTKATLEGDSDMLDTPSARLVMGKRVSGGTGSFDILTGM